MSWEIILVFILLVTTITSLAIEKIPSDVTAILAYSFVLLVGAITKSEYWPNMQDMMSVFCSSAPITIGCMFMVSAALEQCGALELAAQFFQRWAKTSYRKLLAYLILITSFVSAWMNNTAVVIMLMPVVLSVARVSGIHPSKLLIPLSYASIFGGCTTAIGTSTNILVSDILVKFGMSPLGMFELTPLGFPLMLAGLIYMVFFADKLLPNRGLVTTSLSEEERQKYIAEAFVSQDSNLVGKSIGESGLLKQLGVRLLEVVREGVSIKDISSQFILEAGDTLILSCRPSGLVKAHNMQGINVKSTTGLDLEQIDVREGVIVEGVLGPRTSLVGKTLEEINFRQRFRMMVLAVHRRGVNVRDKIGTLRLDFGDTLLLLGTSNAIENLRHSNDILLLDYPPVPTIDMRKRMPLAFGVLIGVVLASAFEFIPMVGAAILGVAVLLGTNSLKPKEAFESVDWRLLILIYAMLGVGQAIDKSGFAYFTARGLVDAGMYFVSAAMAPYVMLAIVYLITLILTEILSNNATAVIMAPIAITLAHTMGVDPRGFVMAVCIASSAGFALPIGYQTHMYVYSVGGYKFSDFMKIGVHIDLVYFLVSVTLIPLLWPF